MRFNTESGLEKGTEIEAHLAPPSSRPPGYSAINQSSLNVIPQDRPRNACRRRFWHLLACTFLLLCALYILQKKRLNPMYPFEHSATAVGPDQCSDHVSWEEVPDAPRGYRVHLRTSVTLPVSASILSVISEGARTHGSLEVSQTADAASDAVVKVDVFYRNQEDFDEATVCRLHPSDNEWGLGIFTPTWRPPPHGDPFHQLRFEVHLRLPAGPSLTVSQLKTDLHNFSQHLRALAGSVHFNKLGLKSTNGRIAAESVAGDKLELHTTNGAVLGQFKTTSELDLHSSNGHAKVSLLPSSPDANGGAYHVTTQTSNGAIDLEFVDAPVDHALTASARTSNGRAEVTMHETFEGSFDLWTTNAGTPTVHARDVRDPAGRGRKRGYLVHANRRNSVRGNVWWGEENKERGSVSVWTTNGRLRLTV
ncbi:hypothetical protein LXA43DRAFT_1097445 [Ganoderma leucocontextum]|nr:hypothetical protein LXA43DRAFT_1097445 [Ganoderma leucocontextum]